MINIETPRQLSGWAYQSVTGWEHFEVRPENTQTPNGDQLIFT